MVNVRGNTTFLANDLPHCKITFAAFLITFITFKLLNFFSNRTFYCEITSESNNTLIASFHDFFIELDPKKSGLDDE